MILALDDDVPDGVVEAIRADEAILDLWSIRLGARPLSADSGRPRSRTGLDGALVLVRHGESTLIEEGRFQGQADSPLTAVGLRQADAGRAIASRTPHDPPALPLPAAPPLEIVHSPLARTTETADASRPHRARGRRRAASRRRPDPGFLEIGQGEWEGLTATTSRHGSARRSRPGDDGRGSRWRPAVSRSPTSRSRVRPALARLLGTR